MKTARKGEGTIHLAEFAESAQAANFVPKSGGQDGRENESASHSPKQTMKTLVEKTTGSYIWKGGGPKGNQTGLEDASEGRGLTGPAMLTVPSPEVAQSLPP